MFTVANASILFGALSYKQNESNFLRNILYTNVRYKSGDGGDVLLTYIDDQCHSKDFSLLKLLTARYRDASVLLCSPYCPCNEK